MTTLDPATLSIIPDPHQVAEIKKVIPQRLVRKGTSSIDMWAMVEALRMDGQPKSVAAILTIPSQSAVVHEFIHEFVHESTSQAEALQRASITGIEDAGADFETLLQALTSEGVGVPDGKWDAVA
jgi:hypothetical protein